MRIRDGRSIGFPPVLAGLLLLAGCAGSAREEAGVSRADVVLAGLSQIGAPYVYGGESPAEGFDCSGLTYYLHHRAGLSIPRTALEQRRSAHSLGRREPRAGDMVFFKTGPDSYHVGLMVDGERFVHASTSRRRVRIDRLDNRYWRSHYLGAGTYIR